MIGGLRPILSERFPTKGMTTHRDDVAEDRDPQVDVLVEADAVGGLHRVGGAEHGRDDRDDVHQRHADDPEHVPPARLERLHDRRLRNFAVLAFLGEGGRLVDLAADDIAGDDDKDAEEERDAPAPGIERFLGHIVRKRQEHGRGEDLTRLHALQGEAGEEAAPAERRMLEDHRARAGDLAGDGEALDQAEHDEERRREQADLLRRSAGGRRRWSRTPSGTCTG